MILNGIIKNKLLRTLSEKDSTYIFILITLVVLTYWRWYFLDAYFIWGDASFFFRFDRHWLEYFNQFNTWSTRSTGLGGYNIVLNVNLIEFLISCITKFFGSSSLGLKFFVYFPATILAPISMFYLAKMVLINRVSAFVSSIVYTFNVYILLSNTGGHLYISIAYGLAPLTLLLYINYLNKFSIRKLLLVGLVSFICSVYEVRIFYILAWLMGFYLLYINLPHVKDLKILIKNLIIGGLPFLIVLILSSYWLLPLLFSGSVTSNIAINRGLFGNGNMYLAQSLAFFHPFWTTGEGIALERQAIPMQHWLIPIFGIIGVIGFRKNKLLGFFIFLWLLGLLLTKQSSWPFKDLYLWLYENWPGFNAYREASKFYLILSLGYSILIGNSIKNLNIYLDKKKYLRLLTPFLVSLIISVFLINIPSLITGKAKGLHVPKSIPSEYIQLERYFDKNYGEYKTLWVPSTSLWSYYDFQTPRIGLYPLYFNSFSEILTLNSNYAPLENNSDEVSDINHKILEVLTQDNSDELLDTLSIRYILVPSDTKGDTEDNVFITYGYIDNRTYILDVLDSLPYLNKIESVDNIDIYENSNYFEKITATKSENTRDKIDINTEKISNSEYRIHINLEAQYIHFSDMYDPNWKLYAGTPSYHEILTGNTTEFRNEKTFALSNRFNIHNSNTVNTYTLIYKPQIYTNIGTFIMAIGITAILIYIAIDLVHNRKNK